MKLDTKKTIFTGLAFLSICAFWQMYDNVVPLILTKTFNLNETISGAVMAMDNLLGLFLLPFFGALSDRTNTRIGRRMPFILGGTAVAVILMNILPRLDNSYYAHPSGLKVAGFIGVLALLLIAMGTYRSPAVALMPDLTPKPLRSRANAIINLMGALGGITYLLIASLLYSSNRVGGQAHVDYSVMFAIVSAIMAVSVIVLFVKIREPKPEEAERDEGEAPERHGVSAIPKDVKRSLGFLLLSVCFWYAVYNAITTWFTTYASSVWGMALGDSSRCLMVATAGAVVSYIPVGALSAKIGRKKTILIGVALLFSGFAGGIVMTELSEGFSPMLYILFAMVGLAWAAINVNSLPMVVEMCSDGDIGCFTGYYYTFSMAAQTITPICAGWLMNHISYSTLFPYAGTFTLLAFATMSRVRHGDSRPQAKKGIDAFDVDD